MQTPTMMNTTTVGSRRSRRFYLNLVTGTLVLAGVLPAWAATLTVTNTDDSGAGSLRDTIATASPGDTIQFSVPNPSAITLTSGKLLITKDLTINGPGAARLALDGNRADRVFEISRGVTVTLSGLTIQNGTGGGIFNFGTLTLTDSTVSGNSGGGIVNYGGTATLTNSTVSNNSGGGISNEGTLTLTDSTVSGNSGGGLNSYNSTAT
ncbi:MAG: hypothetical protein JO185_11035, partial [Acidobacteriaceae bacterium]|nr:hypothetical protein [Acidobacteriaceae bacterium]